MANGRIKGFNNAPTFASAYGIYNLEQQLESNYSSQWPTVNDPYWSSVKLLLHMDGSNNSTTFTDSSSSPKTMTPRGNAKISTGDFVFGNSSAYFDGTGDMLDSGSSADFTMGTGEFTVECWAKEENNGASFQHGVWTFAPQNSSNPVGLNFYFQGTELKVLCHWNADGPRWTVSNTTAWHHYALQRTKYGAIELFIDGILKAPSAQLGSGISPTVNFNDTYFSVGAMFTQNNTTLPFQGYIDEVRVTKGVARYRSNFRVPNGPYPNS